jgi:hypothetical protein
MNPWRWRAHRTQAFLASTPTICFMRCWQRAHAAAPISQNTRSRAADTEPPLAALARMEALVRTNAAAQAYVARVELRTLHMAIRDARLEIEASALPTRAAKLAALLDPEELIAVWKQQGLTDREAEFLLANKHMIARPDFIARAANEAQAQGTQRDSDEYFQTIADSFNRQVAERADKKAKKAAKKAHEPTPEYFQPTPASPEQPEQSASSIYSAPVSRQVSGGGWLSREEQEAARMAGISDTEYARNKVKMLRMQKTGQIQK